MAGHNSPQNSQNVGKNNYEYKKLCNKLAIIGGNNLKF